MNVAKSTVVLAFIRQFAVRDLLWLTLCIGLVMAWTLDHVKVYTASAAAVADANAWRNSESEFEAAMESQGWRVDWPDRPGSPSVASYGSAIVRRIDYKPLFAPKAYLRSREPIMREVQAKERFAEPDRRP